MDESDVYLRVAIALFLLLQQPQSILVLLQQLSNSTRNKQDFEPRMIEITRFLLHRQVPESPQVLPHLDKRFEPPLNQRRLVKFLTPH